MAWSARRNDNAIPFFLAYQEGETLVDQSCLNQWKKFLSYSLAHRLAAAFLAISALRSGLSLSRLAAPPFLPSA
jgi:hypothetical protein